MEAMVIEDPREIARPETAVPVEISDAIQSLVVSNNDEATIASGLLRSVQQAKKAINEKFDGPVKRAHEAHKALTSWRAECIAPLDTAERIIKGKIGSYQTEQERIRRAEQQRLADEARAKAEDERKRLAAVAADVAARLAAAGKQEQADAMSEKAEAISQREIIAPIIEIQNEKVAGVTMRENWKAECYDLAALVKAAAADERLLPYLLANEKVLGQTARALKGSMAVPGVRVWNEPVVAASGR